MTKNTTPITPRIGAMPILNSDELLESQKAFLQRILMQIREIADSEAELENKEYSKSGKDGRQEYLADQLYRRPHQVFLIDGARGSGKTTLLLTIQQYLKLIGQGIPLVSTDRTSILATLGAFEKQFGDELKQAYPNVPNMPSLRFSDKHVVGGSKRQTALYLDVIFPTDFEVGQSMLEGVLAQMVKALNKIVVEHTDRQRRHPETDRDAEADIRARRAQYLIDDANKEVAKGWFLSRNAGQEALLQDSIDYKDFLTKKGEANVASFARTEVWRRFVNDYLDFFHSELLVVFFDDTDVAPESTQDILHTIRIFLDHPRIVTVIAGNLRSMRQDMLLKGMDALGNPIEALTQESESTGREWRQAVRHQIEESLEKVMPRQLRCFLTFRSDSLDIPTELETARGTNGAADGNGRSDFHRVFGMGFDSLCGTMLAQVRDEFLICRHIAHFRDLLGRRQIANERDSEVLEGYVSWWMFRHWYAEELRPHTIRHLAAFKAFVLADKSSQLISDWLPSEHRKRLAVILFESPLNQSLIYRLGDYDPRVLKWLHRQVIRSAWRGDRYIDINDHRIHEHTYSYNYLLFRLDLGIGLPVRENPDESIPKGILPMPSGPNLIGYRPFFPPMLRQRLYGVANGLQHTVIPANCIYFSDLVSLLDVAWADCAQSDSSEVWGSQIIYNWPNFFFFDVEELSAPSHSAKENAATAGNKPSNSAGDSLGTAKSVPADQTNNPAEAAPNEPPDSAENLADTAQGSSSERDPWCTPTKEAWVRDYFINVVLPFSSAHIGRYARTPNNNDNAHDWTRLNAARNTLLRAELRIRSRRLGEKKLDSEEKKEFFETVRKDITHIQRRLDFMSASATNLVERLSMQTIASDERNGWRDKVLDQLFKGCQEDDSMSNGGDHTSLRRHLASYQWLVNDARRAWHAGRIFQNRISETLVKGSFGTEYVDLLATAEVSRRDTFVRTDRYTIPTSASFQRWLDRSEVFADFMKSYREKLGVKLEDLRFDRWYKDFSETRSPEIMNAFTCFARQLGIKYVNSKKLLDVSSSWLARRVSTDCRVIANPLQKGDTNHALDKKFPELDAASLTRLLKGSLTQFKQAGIEANWPLFIDPSVTSSPNDDISTAKEVLAMRTHTRLARNFLFFLYGVTPTLPSLIHIEIASVLMRSAPDEQRADSAFEVLATWTRRTFDFLTFVQNFRRVLEVAKLRLDLVTLCRLLPDNEQAYLEKTLGVNGLNPSEFGVHMALTPDLDFRTLGVYGITLFESGSGTASIEFGDKLEPLKYGWAEFQKKRKKRNSDIAWRPIIATTVENLVDTLNFVIATGEVLRARFPEADSKKSTVQRA